MATISFLRTDGDPIYRDGQIIFNITHPEILLDYKGQRLKFLETDGIEISFDGKNFFAQKNSLKKKIG